MFSVFFTEGPVRNFGDASRSDREVFGRLFAGLLDNGVYIAPSPFEAWFVGTAHSDHDVEETLSAVRAAL
jgi:glutamate-1-semialdehyde 2,1-aminomutase